MARGLRLSSEAVEWVGTGASTEVGSAVGSLHVRAQGLQVGEERRAVGLSLAGGSLGGGRGRQDLRLILKELAHEAKVG